MLTTVLAFAGVAAVINIVPGLDTMLVLRTSVSGGRLAGFAGGVGVTVGCLVWGVAAAAGITGLLAASHLAFDVLRIAGAAYLAWLGARALWRARRSPRGEPPVEDEKPARGGLAAFRAGVTTNLLNPKAGIFYMSLLPQFIPHGAPAFGTAMLLTLIDVGELLLWFALLAAAASAVAGRIRRTSFKRRMEQVSGVVFLGFAVGLVADRT